MSQLNRLIQYDSTVITETTLYKQFMNKNINNQPSILKIAVPNENPELLELYKTHIEKHNQSVSTDPFPNAGFDIFVPKEVIFDPHFSAKMVSHEIKCEMVNLQGISMGYFVFPRSSISKTPLMLANHTGIIDSGYRGPLIGAFRSLQTASTYTVDKHSRLLQICNPSLTPIFAVLVNESDLSTTSRGDGGFGSTGV